MKNKNKNATEFKLFKMCNEIWVINKLRLKYE